MPTTVGTSACQADTQHRLHPLTRPIYIASLALLLANDLWFKRMWPGFSTGKLSDVTGLFAFAVFAACFLRRPALVCITVGATFVFWKSRFADPLVETWNVSLPLWPLSRVTDASDLIAVAILPFAYRYTVGSWENRLRLVPATKAKAHIARAAIAVGSVVAFANTSAQRYTFELQPTDPARLLEISLPVDAVAMRLEQCGFRTHEFAMPVQPTGERHYLFIWYRTKALRPAREISISTIARSTQLQTTLELQDVRIYHQTSPGNEAVILRDFQKRVRDCFGSSLGSAG